MGEHRGTMPALTSTENRLLRRLPAFSPIAIRLLSAISDERSSFKEVARLISLDPVLSGEVLRLANSGLYGRRFEVRSILHAIAMLGFGKLSQIAMTAALWRGLPRRTAPYVREWWRHSIATALLARQCGDEFSSDFDYTAGLLHGVGQLALFADAPDDYPELVDCAYGERSNLAERERQVFGVDHASLAGILLESWGLPEKLCNAVASHHSVSTSPKDLEHAVQIACLGAEYSGFGRCGCHESLALSVPDALAELLADNNVIEKLVTGVNEIECSLG